MQGAVGMNREMRQGEGESWVGDWDGIGVGGKSEGIDVRVRMTFGYYKLSPSGGVQSLQLVNITNTAAATTTTSTDHHFSITTTTNLYHQHCHSIPP